MNGFGVRASETGGQVLALAAGTPPSLFQYAEFLSAHRSSQWASGIASGADRIGGGVEPHEIGVFVRPAAQLRGARQAAKQAGVTAIELYDKVETTAGRLSVRTMHLAKGLEFRAVAVMASDDEVLSLQERIEAVADRRMASSRASARAIAARRTRSTSAR